MSQDRTQQLPDDGVRRILPRLDSLDTRMTGLEDRMTALEEQVDRRLRETRPIWEQILSRMVRIETRLETIEYGVADLNLKLRDFNQDLLKMQHRQDATDERLRRLKAESEP